MKPTTIYRIIFHQLKSPCKKKERKYHRKNIITGTELHVMDDYQHWEKEDGKIGHEAELVLIHSCRLFLTTVECGVKLVAEQLQEKGRQQNTKTDADIGNKRQSGHNWREIGVPEHDQTCSNRKKIKH